ncbi:MAG: DUF359 domain-containing protein [Candidatus Heimdallarchaeota archaeon]|nr:DUF359 domain-containing protein [Candidatus Heimdallarchaeota archaeon]
MKPRHLFLPDGLRSRLGKPMGELVEGTIESTIPRIKEKLDKKDWIVGVGDVTTEILVENKLNPVMIITDGQTKRQKLTEWKKYPGYIELNAYCPAAEITIEVWDQIKHAIELIKTGNKVHLLIDGEEDLLVLVLLVELPFESVIVYGQPNKGAVIRVVNQASKYDAEDIICYMDEGEKGKFDSKLIKIEPYDPNWANLFIEFKNKLEMHLNTINHAIFHVGSTSVEGLCAKPILDIDILIEKQYFGELEKTLEEIGYESRGEQGIPGRFAFKQRKMDIIKFYYPHHLYVCFTDSDAFHEHLYLREILRVDQDLRNEYCMIKNTLAKEYRNNIAEYVAGKTNFIRKIIDKAKETIDISDLIRL